MAHGWYVDLVVALLSSIRCFRHVKTYIPWGPIHCNPRMTGLCIGLAMCVRFGMFMMMFIMFRSDALIAKSPSSSLTHDDKGPTPTNDETLFPTKASVLAEHSRVWAHDDSFMWVLSCFHQ